MVRTMRSKTDEIKQGGRSVKQMDREKIIKGLECCLTLDSPCGDCPYYSYEDIQELDCERNLRHDAIAMLKEDCHNCKLECLLQKYDELKEKYDALLKEQDAVEPKTGHWDVFEYCANEGIYCSKCHIKVFDRTTKPKKKLSQYCPHCGSRNEQFFKDGEVVFT